MIGDYKLKEDFNKKTQYTFSNNEIIDINVCKEIANYIKEI